VATQAQTVQIPKRLPLTITPENRATSTDKDSRLVNCFLEKQKDDTYQLYRRPGLAESSQPSGGAANGYGVFNWLGNIYSIFGNTVYKDGVAVAGTVNTANGVYRFDQCLGATPKLQLGNGVKAYNYDSGGGLVEITDGDFPASFRKGWAYLNGITYVAVSSSGSIQGSDVNDPTTWDPLDVIVAQIEPDFNIALGKQLVYVVDFKQWSVELFYDAGNASGSSLGRVEGAKVDYGCASQESVQNIDGMLLWVTATKSPLRQLAMMKGLKAEIISSPAVDRLLTAADFTTVFSWQLLISGHRFYVVTSKVSNLTLAFDVDERMWYQWTDSSGNYLPIVSSTYTSTGSIILQHETNGRLYTAAMSQLTDAGNVIQVDIYTPNFDGGTQRGKQLNQLTILGDKTPGSVLQVRSNDDDYDPTKWSDFREIDLSDSLPMLDNEGTFIRRAYNFRHRCPTEFRIEAAEMQIDICTL